MASYLSKVPDFGTYQPEVNAELYGKLLVKKEAEYQAGVQKIDSALNYVSALPVASERDRVYLQEKVDKITSEINRDVNVDWSNLSVQKLTSSHIKDIAKDPNVQMAVYNASKLKNGMKNLQEDEDVTEGKSILNKQAYLDDYNNWLQNGELGKTFKGEYNKFLDPVDDFVKYYKDKNPDQKIEVKTAGYQYDEQGNIKRGADGKPIVNAQFATQEWDAITLKYKEIRPDEVERDFQNFIGMNPQYQKQLEINSKYKYKGVDALKTLEMLDSEIEKNIYNKKQALESVTIELGTMKADDKRKSQYLNISKNLQEEINILNSQITPEAKFEKFNSLKANPELVQSFREQLYKHDLSNSLASRFSYRKEIDMGFHGAGPTEKAKNLFDERYKAELIRLAQNKDSRDKTKADREDAAAAAKQKEDNEKENSPYGVMTLSGSTDELKRSDWNKFSTQLSNMNAKIHDFQNSYLVDSYSQMFPDKFRVSPYTFKLEPKPEYQEELNKMYEINKEKYLNGEYLSKEDMNHFKQIVEDEKLLGLMKNKNKQYEDIWKEELKRRPNIVASLQSLDRLETNPIPVKKAPSFKPYDYITKKDIDNFNVAKKEVEEYMQPFSGTFASLNPYNQPDFKKVDEIYRRHNLSLTKAQDITTFAQDYLQRSDEIENQKEEFLSNYVRASQVLVNLKFVPLSNIDPNTGKKMTEKEMNNLIRPFVERDGKDIVIEQRSIGYVHDPTTGKFSLAVKKANEEMDFIPLLPNEAAGLRLKPMGSDDYLDKVLRLNTLPSGESSNTYSNNEEISHTFMDAVPLGNIKGQEIRYHVKKVQGQYYLEYWKKDPKKGKDDPGYIVKDENGIPVTAQSNSLQDIKIKIKNFIETGSNAIPGRYYSQSSQDNEQETGTETE